jgi:hypothetical protein
LRLASAAGKTNAVGGPVLELVFEFLAAASDRIDVKAGNAGKEAVAAVADLDGLQGDVPASLLLVETAEEQVHASMQFLLGARVLGLTMLTFTLVKDVRGHVESSSGYTMKI